LILFKLCGIIYKIEDVGGGRNMSDLFGEAGLPPTSSDSLHEDYYRRNLVTNVPDFLEPQTGDKAFLWQEFEKQIGAIDSELVRLVRKWKPTTSSLLKFLTSVGAYPRKEKIRSLKKALTAPNRNSDEGFMQITKILLGDVRLERVEIPITGSRLTTPPVSIGLETFYDPVDPDAERVTGGQIDMEIVRRRRWRKAWEDYLEYLKRRSGVPISFKFFCDLPSETNSIINISPHLRLPNGEYIAPRKLPPSSGTGGGTDVPGVVIGPHPIVPTPEPVSPSTPGESKKIMTVSEPQKLRIDLEVELRYALPVIHEGQSMDNFERVLRQRLKYWDIVCTRFSISSSGKGRSNYALAIELYARPLKGGSHVYLHFVSDRSYWMFWKNQPRIAVVMYEDVIVLDEVLAETFNIPVVSIFWKDAVGVDTLLPVGPISPPSEEPILPQPVEPIIEPPVDNVIPVSEEKKDEKKAFPWWIVIAIAVVVLFFIMKD
jgi:hypothetical protein